MFAPCSGAREVKAVALGRGRWAPHRGAPLARNGIEVRRNCQRPSGVRLAVPLPMCISDNGRAGAEGKPTSEVDTKGDFGCCSRYIVSRTTFSTLASSTVSFDKCSSAAT
jgi:hypothetical protein